ncbi:hypothetical protein D3C72_1564260 [compost metagenome]
MLQPLERVQLVLELLLVGTIAPPELEQVRGRRGRLQAPRFAFEQRRAELFLEQADLPGDHRRRSVEAFGGAADGPVRQHLAEIPQPLLIDLSHVELPAQRVVGRAITIPEPGFPCLPRAARSTTRLFEGRSRRSRRGCCPKGNVLWT